MPGKKPCIITLPDVEVEVELPVKFTLVCESPTSSICVCEEGDCGKIVRVTGYPWDSKYDIVSGAVWVSSRWCCSGRCGLVNRVYITRDGKLVVSHDDVHAVGIHVIEFTEDIKAKLVEIYEKLSGGGKSEVHNST